MRAGHSGWAGSKQFEFRLLEALPWNHSIYDPGGMRLMDGGTAVPPDRVGDLADRADSALAHPATAAARGLDRC